MERVDVIFFCLCFLLGYVSGGTTPQPLFESYQQGSNTPMPIDQQELDENGGGSVPDVYTYLTQYNYMKEMKGSGPSSYVDMAGPIKDFQRSCDLPQTGQMDKETVDCMKLPRCGLGFEREQQQMRRRKRYTLSGRRWRQNDLTYRISRFTQDLGRPEQTGILQRAFKAWSDVTPLTFTERGPNQNVDIDILFASRSHGDGNPFDGRGRTLAHAYFPGNGIGGDAHFDDDESFTQETRTGVNLFQVAAHEFGHSLGLGHSDDRSALMFAFYRGYQPNFQLADDDIRGIQALYGSPTPTPPPVATNRPPTQPPAPTNRPVVTTSTTTTSAPRPNPPTSRPGICDPRFDAMASAKTEGNRPLLTYGFSGTQYYNLSRVFNTNGFSIQRTFHPDLDRVDAAIASPYNGRSDIANLYLFKGNYFYYFIVFVGASSQNIRFIRRSLLSQAVPGLPSGIDALFEWSRNGKLYIFKGRQYWRVTGNSIDPGYPRSITAWRLPAEIQRVDAVVTYFNGRTYFFAEDKYYAFDDQNIRFSRGYSIRQIWLRCPANNYDQGTTPPSVELEKEGTFVEVKTVLEEEQEQTSAAPVTTGTNVLNIALVCLAWVYLQKLC